MDAVRSHVTIESLSCIRDERHILDNVDVSIERGKITAIMGPSGCGKTTLLRLIGAQLFPDSGRVLVDDKNIHQLKRKELYRQRRDMGMLYQSAALFTTLNVFENVAFPLREHTQLSEPLIRDIVLMKLEAVGLRGARNLMTNELSGGMARRVAIARAIALDPNLIMYDEPFAGQDPITMGVLMTLIKKINDVTGMTTILVSHDIHETVSVADYIYVIAEGRVVGEGTPSKIMENPSAHVLQFMKGLPDGVVPFHYPAADYCKDLLNV